MSIIDIPQEVLKNHFLPQIPDEKEIINFALTSKYCFDVTSQGIDQNKKQLYREISNKNLNVWTWEYDLIKRLPDRIKYANFQLDRIIRFQNFEPSSSIIASLQKIGVPKFLNPAIHAITATVANLLQKSDSLDPTPPEEVIICAKELITKYHEYDRAEEIIEQHLSDKNKNKVYFDSILHILQNHNIKQSYKLAEKTTSKIKEGLRNLISRHEKTGKSNWLSYASKLEQTEAENKVCELIGML